MYRTCVSAPRAECYVKRHLSQAISHHGCIGGVGVSDRPLQHPRENMRDQLRAPSSMPLTLPPRAEYNLLLPSHHHCWTVHNSHQGPSVSPHGMATAQTHHVLASQRKRRIPRTFSKFCLLLSRALLLFALPPRITRWASSPCAR